MIVAEVAYLMSLLVYLDSLVLIDAYRNVNLWEVGFGPINGNLCVVCGFLRICYVGHFCRAYCMTRVQIGVVYCMLGVIELMLPICHLLIRGFQLLVKPINFLVKFLQLNL